MNMKTHQNILLGCFKGKDPSHYPSQEQNRSGGSPSPGARHLLGDLLRDEPRPGRAMTLGGSLDGVGTMTGKEGV